MELIRGSRMTLDSFLDISKPFCIQIATEGEAIYDNTCFGLDAEGKLSDDRYMVFFNQTQSPNGGIEYDGVSQFTVNVAKLPDTIHKLSFTTSIDGEGDMSQIRKHEIAFVQEGKNVVTMQLSGTDFVSETAIISIELYRKNGWRLCAVGRGYNGGLADLLKDFGGEQDPNDFVESKPKVSLEKKIEQNAPKLVSLAKPLKVVLEKHNLQDTIARVALVLDISGSMTQRYANGTVQEIVNKTLPIAVQFDDDGELDFWYYGSHCKRMETVTMQNYESAVPKDWDWLMNTLGCLNNEPEVMTEIIEEYEHSALPAYVVFITDGGIDKETKIKQLLIKSSRMPIFWQFVGVGGSSYGVLKRLDSMSGRYVDNASFFALDDFRTVPNDELYSRLLNEFPDWLKEAKAKRIF